MAHTSSDEFAVTERRLKVSRLHFQGRNQTDIALELDVSQSTVQRDLQWLMESWRESAVRDLELMFETELMRLRQLQSEAWQAWERSQWRDVSGEKVQVPGDPRFLNIVFRCLQQTEKLMQMMAGRAKTNKSPQQQADVEPASGDSSGFRDPGCQMPFADDSKGVQVDIHHGLCDGAGNVSTGDAQWASLSERESGQYSHPGHNPHRDWTPTPDAESGSIEESASDEDQDKKPDSRDQRGSGNVPIPRATVEDVMTPDYLPWSERRRRQLATERNPSGNNPANCESIPESVTGTIPSPEAVLMQQSAPPQMTAGGKASAACVARLSIIPVSLILPIIHALLSLIDRFTEQARILFTDIIHSWTFLVRCSWFLVETRVLFTPLIQFRRIFIGRAWRLRPN